MADLNGHSSNGVARYVPLKPEKPNGMMRETHGFTPQERAKFDLPVPNQKGSSAKKASTRQCGRVLGYHVAVLGGPHLYEVQSREDLYSD